MLVSIDGPRSRIDVRADDQRLSEFVVDGSMFGGSRGRVRRVHGTADGSLIVVQGGDRFVTLHDVETGLALGSPLAIPDAEVDS